jgi:hypothetical protein
VTWCGLEAVTQCCWDLVQGARGGSEAITTPLSSCLTLSLG